MLSLCIYKFEFFCIRVFASYVKKGFDFFVKKVTDRGRRSKCQIDRRRLFSSFICDTELELWLFGPSDEISLMRHPSQTWFLFMCNICMYYTVYLRSVQLCIFYLRICDTTLCALKWNSFDGHSSHVICTPRRILCIFCQAGNWPGAAFKLICERVLRHWIGALTFCVLKLNLFEYQSLTGHSWTCQTWFLFMCSLVSNLMCDM